MTLAVFPNVKLVLREVLLTLGCPVATSVPPGFTGDPAMLRIRVYGGSDTGISDFPRFDIDSLASTEQGADELAEQVRQLLISGPHKTTHGVLDKVTTDTRPNTVPYSDTISNTTAAYRGALRRS